MTIFNEYLYYNCLKSIWGRIRSALDFKLCRSQTMDGAGNMAEKQKGCMCHSVYQQVSQGSVSLLL